MFRKSFLIRKPISPTWFEDKRRELAEIANALKPLKSRPEIKENCQQIEFEVIQRQDPLGSPAYRTIEERKKEIEEARAEKIKQLAKSNEEKQERARQKRTNTPQTRSQFWREHNAEKVAEIKHARAQALHR